MGKISEEAKKRYFEKVKEYKTVLEQIIQREKNLKKVVERKFESCLLLPAIE